MRFLNRVIFINSADKSLRYAEVNLDGNVHFIGTQGVGKSTLLRAILFFYNADTQKLGIPREKKNYNEYYFPYQNSYIIYEVQTETGTFCVLTFKSQGRVAFRFFDAAYDKRYFIDSEGKAFETWDKTRAALGPIGTTRIISSYEEYRNILYGNNKGLSNEFRKYALIESKQYQNIPRTVANVFLNAKLDAEFVKETIIKSLNEDEVKIDLTTYSQTHLKDFESNLNDIKKWTIGKVDNQADKIATTYSALKHLELTKKDLAFQIGYAINNVKEKQPKVEEQLLTQELKRDRIKERLNDLENIFEKKKGDVQKRMGEVASKLKDIKKKREEYEAIKIEIILERVSKKPALELEKKNLSEEKEILTSKFIEIQQRYEAQLRQLENQLKEFENNYQTEKNNAQSSFLNFKEELQRKYDVRFEEIRKQHTQELEVATALVKEKENAITVNKIKRSEILNKRFFETEIVGCNDDILKLNSDILKAENVFETATEKRKNIEKEWLLEESSLKEDTKRKKERLSEQHLKLKERIGGIDIKIENSKDSLYGWLNKEVPNWDQTIGKVIDEENVLYKSGLHPKKISHGEMNFFGISIDTNEISKKVKTVADLQKDKDAFKAQINTIQKEIASLDTAQNDELEKLRRKFLPKVKEQKDILDTNKYQSELNKIKLDEVGVRLSEWKNKAAKEQQASLENIDTSTLKLSEEKLNAEAQFEKIKASIAKLINAKKKEKEGKIKTAQQELADNIDKINLLVEREKIVTSKKEEAIKSQQKKELDTKGADTKKIDAIELRLSIINPELIFIDNNRDKVAEYNKDKRELFDNEDEFKSKKNLLEKQLDNELAKHKQQQQKFIQDLGIHKANIESIEKTLADYAADVSAFESFTKTEVYQSVEQFISSFAAEHKTENNCTNLISEIYTTDNTITKRYVDLQEAINKFTSNFQEQNLFSFKVKLAERFEYFEFAEMLKEFIDENKIAEYKQRVEERFAHIIRQIGRETNSLIEKEGEISKVINEINNDFVSRQFVTAVKSVELKTIESKNRIFTLLVEIKIFNDENTFDLGTPDLFSSDGQASKNEKAISLLKQLITEMSNSKEKEISLSDSFELLFKIVENDNDTGWVEKLTNVGSEGTDILVKAMINIMLLNVFKEKASKKQTDDFRLHCMMDEIGKLHPNNVKGILKFANDRNILLINSSPTSLNATDYRYTYLLSKDNKNITSVKRLVRKIIKSEV